MKTQRTLRVFSGELDSLERSASAQFVRLQLEAQKPLPSSDAMHTTARRVLDDAHLISLFFFPSKANKIEATRIRSDLLKDHFNITEKSVLASRAVRNHLAHIDERLDSWAENSEMRTFGRNMIGSILDAKRIGIREEDILGMISSDTLDYVFREATVNLEEVIQEIRRIGFVARRTIRATPWPKDKK
ncbi:MAG: hypothetical protein WD969_04575 [Paracoccaceae bacterium]